MLSNLTRVVIKWIEFTHWPSKTDFILASFSTQTFWKVISIECIATENFWTWDRVEAGRGWARLRPPNADYWSDYSALKQTGEAENQVSNLNRLSEANFRWMASTPWFYKFGFRLGNFMENLAQAFAANSICKIPCWSTRWVRSLNAVHKLSNNERNIRARDEVRAAFWTRTAGEKLKRYPCAMPPPRLSMRAGVEHIMIHSSMVRILQSDSLFSSIYFSVMCPCTSHSLYVWVFFLGKIDA